MKKTSLLIMSLAFATAGSALAADRPASSAAIRTTTSSVSVASPAYYYDYTTHSSATVSTSSFVIAAARTISSNRSGKSTSSTGTKTTSSTGTTTTGTTTTTTTGTTTVSPAFGASTTIYAAIRTDGIAGTGTKQNPYDASTQAKFDAILANLLKANGAQRTSLSLGAGTYMVTPLPVVATSANPGGYANNIPGNLEIIGAGEDKTIIRAGIVPTGSSTYWMLAQVGSMAGDYFENLTIDCNIENQTLSKVTINGIRCLHVAGGATHTLASNVHVINGGSRVGDTGITEWFGINFSDYQAGTMAEITHCLVDTYQGTGGCTALVSTVLIADNTVILNNNDPDGLNQTGTKSGGFQDAFSPAQTVSGNTCSQCTWGVYSDVDDQINVNIENNVFTTLYGGVWMYIWSSTSILQDVYVHDNTITKTYGAAVILGNGATTVTNTNLFVYNNNITTTVIPTLQADDLIYVVAAQNSEVFGNTFTMSPASKTSVPYYIELPYCDLSSIAWYNNKFSTGTAIPGPTGTVNHALSTVVTPTN